MCSLCSRCSNKAKAKVSAKLAGTQKISKRKSNVFFVFQENNLRNTKNTKYFWYFEKCVPENVRDSVGLRIAGTQEHKEHKKISHF
jgi:hypothetical protein